MRSSVGPASERYDDRGNLARGSHSVSNLTKDAGADRGKHDRLHPGTLGCDKLMRDRHRSDTPKSRHLRWSSPDAQKPQWSTRAVLRDGKSRRLSVSLRPRRRQRRPGTVGEHERAPSVSVTGVVEQSEAARGSKSTRLDCKITHATDFPGTTSRKSCVKITVYATLDTA